MLTSLYQQKALIGSGAIVCTAAMIGSFWFHSQNAEAEASIPKAAQASAEWLAENADTVRQAKTLIEKHDQNKQVLETFNCSFDWEQLKILDCPK